MMIDWDEEIEVNLFSGQLERVARGLHDLKMRVGDVDEWEMAPIGIDILDPFETMSTEIQEDFLYILIRHTNFVPPLTEDQIIHTMVALVLRYGDSAIAYKVALELKVAANRVAAITKAMQEALQQNGLTSQSLNGVEWLASCLLDGKDDVRDATLAVLSQATRTPFVAEVIAYVLPQMTEAERMKFTQESDGVLNED
jgi:hypothetical protein